MVYFLLPMMVVPAVSGFIFQMLFQVDGPINGMLSFVWPGDVTLQWLSDPSLAIWGVMIADIWQWTPLMFLIFLSGLVALPGGSDERRADPRRRLLRRSSRA